MGSDSKIEWTKHTHNPWIGCTAVSAACDHCYAEHLGKRFGVAWGAQAPRKRTSDAYRRQPFLWNRRAAAAGRVDRVFSASLADIWDNSVPIEWLAEELDTIRQTTSLRWLLLTKRPQLIRLRLAAAAAAALAMGNRATADWIDGWLDHAFPPPNVWLGTTTETQDETNRRIPKLFSVAAAGYFVSAEPLLGPIDYRAIPLPDWGPDVTLDALGGIARGEDRLAASKQRIGWVITGGESGIKARSSHPDWHRSIRDQCQAAGVPFFFKQWGEWGPAIPDDPALPFPNGWKAAHGYPHVAKAEELTAEAGAAFVARWGKKFTGAALDGREWREVPE